MMARYLEQKQVSGLPVGYTRCEYVQSTSNLYIDTNFQLASTDVVMIKFKNNTTGDYGIYGIDKSGQSTVLYANGTYYGLDGSNNQVNTGVSVDTNWHEVVHDFVNGKLTFDGVTTTFTPFTFTNTNNFPLLGRKNSSGIIGNYFRGAIAYFKIYRNGVLVVDLVPCRKGNIRGMYDLVRDTFYQKTGTGTLGVGAQTYITEQYSVGKLGNRYVINKEV